MTKKMLTMTKKMVNHDKKDVAMTKKMLKYDRKNYCHTLLGLLYLIHRTYRGDINWGN